MFVLKILFEKKNTVGGMRNDPFGYSNTSNIFRLISKYLLLASQTNINIILQDFLYSFWVTTPLKSMERCHFQNQVIFFQEVLSLKAGWQILFKFHM